MQEPEFQAEPALDRSTAQQNNVTFHIDRLVLDGMPLAGAQISQLQAALQRELTHLLTRDGLGSGVQGIAAPMLRAPVVQVSAPFCPADLGRQIARSVHESLTKSL